MEAAIIAAAVRTGNRKAIDVISGSLERAQAAQDLGIFTQLQAKSALAAARLLDQKIARGEQGGRLAGVPIAVKDNIAERGQAMTAGSNMLFGHVAARTATALKRLQAEGAIVIGRTNMDAFGMGSSGENSAYGPTKNPLNTAHVPGGSSSGSAAAVAADIVPLALGSDTGGSVRQPASFCGLVGLKPTYGRISRSGLLAFASSLDQIGPLTKTVRDAAIVTSIMAGYDKSDPTSLVDLMQPFTPKAKPNLEGCRIGMPRQCWDTNGNNAVNNTVRAAISKLEALGAIVVSLEIPSLTVAIPTYYLLTSAEAASNLSRFDGIRFGWRAEADDLLQSYVATRSKGFGPEVQRRILLGTFALAEGWSDALYRKADAMRITMRAEMDQALEAVDILAMPTAPTPAFKLGAKTANPIDMYRSDIYTTPPSLTGHPAISVPAGTVDGLPVGLQLVGKRGDEAAVLRFGMAVTGR
jgi:aspartyl-tRNA(Asn)/glutamyl-tRNA(Gln) amidotransferase subunit A